MADFTSDSNAVSTNDRGESSDSLDITVPADSDLLLVFINIEDGTPGTVSGVTYDGGAMTEAEAYSGSNKACALYYLSQPGAGTKTIAITLSETVDELAWGAESFSALGGGATLGTTDTDNTGWGGSVAITLTVPSGGMIAGASVSTTSETTHSVAGNIVESFEETTDFMTGVGIYNVTDDGETTLTADWDDWGSMAIAGATFEAVAGGGGTPSGQIAYYRNLLGG